MAQAESQPAVNGIPPRGTETTVTAAAARYGIHRRTVKNWIYRDNTVRVLHPVRNGVPTIIDEHDVAEIVATHEIGFGYRRKLPS